MGLLFFEEYTVFTMDLTFNHCRKGWGGKKEGKEGKANTEEREGSKGKTEGKKRQGKRKKKGKKAKQRRELGKSGRMIKEKIKKNRQVHFSV